MKLAFFISKAGFVAGAAGSAIFGNVPACIMAMAAFWCMMCFQWSVELLGGMQ